MLEIYNLTIMIMRPIFCNKAMPSINYINLIQKSGTGII